MLHLLSTKYMHPPWVAFGTVITGLLKPSTLVKVYTYLPEDASSSVKKGANFEQQSTQVPHGTVDSGKSMEIISAAKCIVLTSTSVIIPPVTPVDKRILLWIKLHVESKTGNRIESDRVSLSPNVPNCIGFLVMFRSWF